MASDALPAATSTTGCEASRGSLRSARVSSRSALDAWIAAAMMAVRSSRSCVSDRVRIDRARIESDACDSGKRLVVLLGIRPVGKAGHEIELSQQAGDDVVAVAAPADVIQLRDRLGERRVHFGDRLLREIFALRFETAFVFEEFLPIEVCSGDSASCERGRD